MIDSTGGCDFDAIEVGKAYTCRIENNADPVIVSVESLWNIDGGGGSYPDTRYQLGLFCDAEIEGGNTVCPGDWSGENNYPDYQSCVVFGGDGDDIFEGSVIPEYGGTNCWVLNNNSSASIEVEIVCNNIAIAAGYGGNCRVINTIYLRGVMTLNQFGLAILSLLMLGIGFSGIRPANGRRNEILDRRSIIKSRTLTHRKV